MSNIKSSELHTPDSALFYELNDKEAMSLAGGSIFGSIFGAFKSVGSLFGSSLGNHFFGWLSGVFKNPWGYATGNQQNDANEMGTWNRNGG